MKLTRQEETKLTTQGLLAVLLCMAIAGAAYYVPKIKVDELKSHSTAISLTNDSMRAENKRVSKEIIFLKENEKMIDTMWATLKGWGNGVKADNVEALINSGLDTQTPITTTKIPNNPIEYAGIKISGEKTEFQRMMVALGEVEKAQGLLQVRSAFLQLPPNAEPNGAKPTFLNIQLEIVAPSSK